MLYLTIIRRRRGDYRYRGIFAETKSVHRLYTEESVHRSVLKLLILFCDWRGLIKESPR